jgi:N-acetylglutamate synthase-like GNAT family acetyltransferase
VAERFGLTEGNCPRHPSNCRADWVERDMDRGVVYYALESDGRVAGSVALEFVRPGLCNLERLAVLPEHRKRGFGRALVCHVFAEARKLGCDTVRIGVIAEQTELKDWYRGFGFIETETRDFAHLPFRVTFMTVELG